MKMILISKDAFDRAFDDFGREMDLAKHEALEFIPNDELNRARHALQEAQRKWVYAFRRLQRRLEDAP